ncbi:Brix-domain-containing protein [Piromyces finnis]|uniref:Brix-domain-containing protein n=1 Tax=Piromyces finnis TaxID=1754191 RepID=A0A1Y1V4A9_9FUNG|nr:Brix-domain-containing protein [Piromyces finnis]|eukprot:ORX46907.1 Brix-domain-containing protein [Piromyces finnis]
MKVSRPNIKSKISSVAHKVKAENIKNKMKRADVVAKLKHDKAQKKLEMRKQRKKEEEEDPTKKEERLKKNIPKTLENTREFDETIVMQDEETDEFAEYFNGATPKILITTSRKSTPNTYRFTDELVDIFPNSEFVKRHPKFDLKKMVEMAIEQEYTDVIVVNEDKKQPTSMSIMHLPNGPTANFKLSSVRLTKDIAGHGRATSHKPELILNNFNTRLGHTIGRMFSALFPPIKQFEGRQVATFHNQRDFIFFRRHRYIFKDGKKVNLQELGPRFTLKLKSLQRGTFDTKFGDYEWIFRPEMETSRRRFFL